MRITIFGAGNIGLACSSVLSHKHLVSLYTRKESCGEETLSYEYEGEQRVSDPIKVTNSLAEACAADLILCTYPAFLRQAFISDIEDLVSPGTMIGFVPGYGGVEYYCRKILDKGCTVFGMQRVPYVSRSNWNERTAAILSAKANLYVAALPKRETAGIRDLLEELFSIPTIALEEFLAVTLVPSNPLLHTSGAYGIFKDYEEGQTYPEQLMFYEQWNDETSRFLLAYDDELQAICKALSPIDLKEVVSLREYYESPTAEAMTRKLKSIRAFEVVKAPMKTLEDGSFVPNWDDRMFVEDYPFGVAIIKDIALLAGVETPTVDTLLKFYEKHTGIRYFEENGNLAKDSAQAAIPRMYGLDSLSALQDFYSKQ